MPIKVFWLIAKTVVCIGCHCSRNNLLQQLLFADAVDPPTTGESENTHWSERQ